MTCSTCCCRCSTDGQGRVVDFSNTLIILTSNLGSQFLSNLPDDGKVADVEDQVMDVVRGHFRPEFLNRLDEIILFHRLAMEHMAPIVEIQVGRVQKLLDDRKITLELTDAALRWLGRVGYDPVYGARPLKRAIQQELENSLSQRILAGEFEPGSTIVVDTAGDETGFTARAAAQARGAALLAGSARRNAARGQACRRHDTQGG